MRDVEQQLGKGLFEAIERGAEDGAREVSRWMQLVQTTRASARPQPEPERHLRLVTDNDFDNEVNRLRPLTPELESHVERLNGQLDTGEIDPRTALRGLHNFLLKEKQAPN